MTSYSDLAEWAMAMLCADTAGLLPCLVKGKDGVFQSGDLTPKAVDDAQAARKRSEGSGALAVLVMDVGEDISQTSDASLWVFVYDRGGYDNIRAARDAVIACLGWKSVCLNRGGTCLVRFVSRTGHEHFDKFDLDYERIEFRAAITAEETKY